MNLTGHNFDIEESIIDKYVEVKESGQNGDHLILQLIQEHFLPLGRFEESRSWLRAIGSEVVSYEAEKLIKSEAKVRKVTQVSRAPQNKDWQEADVSIPAVESSDQQYHYDRTLAYSNATQHMFDEVEDVTECRNEWITFVARNAFKGGLGAKGADLNVLAMAISDYIEFVLIPDDFYGFEDEVELISPQLTVEQALVNLPDDISYLREHARAVLADQFLTHFYCQSERGGKTQFVIVTPQYVAFVPEKKSGWSPASFELLYTQHISTISVGTEYHTQYQGVTSTSEVNWTLTFFTTEYTQFTKYLYLGRNEREMNQNRPIHGKTLESLSQYFDLEQGDSFETSDGYSTSIGFGWWV